MEQLVNELTKVEDMELTWLIYTIFENKGQNSQNQDLSNAQISLDKLNSINNIMNKPNNENQIN